MRVAVRVAIAVGVTVVALGAAAGSKPVRPQVVTIDQVLTDPMKFDGRQIAVNGFLDMQIAPRDISAVFLYKTANDFHARDTKCILVMVNSSVLHKMLQDRTHIDKRDVLLIGVFHAVPSAGGGHVEELQVREFSVVNERSIQER